MKGMVFLQNDIDPCLFYCGSLTVLVYVDDCLIFCKENQEVDNIIQELRDRHFTLTDEGNVDAYLGVQVERERDGHLNITQPFLIKRIINPLGNLIIDANTKRTPVEHSNLLHKYEDGPERNQIDT